MLHYAIHTPDAPASHLDIARWPSDLALHLREKVGKPVAKKQSFFDIRVTAWNSGAYMHGDNLYYFPSVSS